MSQQERREGVRANTGDVKRRCEDDTHTHKHRRRRLTHRTHRGGKRGEKQKLNVWRSLMSLQFLSTVPLGPVAHECMWMRASVCVCMRVCACVCIHLWNTGLCIIYQTAVSFVLLFTLRARSCANREPGQQEWQPPKQFNWRLKQLIMPLLSLQCNYLSMKGC